MIAKTKTGGNGAMSNRRKFIAAAVAATAIIAFTTSFLKTDIATQLALPYKGKQLWKGEGFTVQIVCNSSPSYMITKLYPTN